MKIEVESTKVVERTISTEKGDFTVREQEAFFYIPGKKYPVPFTLQLAKDASPHAPGLYDLNGESLYINRFGQLAVKREIVLDEIDAESVEAA